jgi:hypothetical protein
MEFKLRDVFYTVQKPNAFGQFELARRLAPILAVLAMGEREAVRQKFCQSFCALTAHLPEDEITTTIRKCLALVSRKHENVYAPIIVGDSIMFADVNEDLSLTLEIVWQVLEGLRLVDFFAENLSGPAKKPKSK